MSNLSIISVNKNNYEYFYRLHLWRKTGNEVSEAFELDSPKYLEQQNYYLYMAVIGDTPVGYVSVIIIPKPDSRQGTMFIDDIWVAPKYRRNGFAKHLISKIEQVASNHGLWKLRLCVNMDNYKAINLYESKSMKSISDCFFMESDLRDIKHEKIISH